MPKYVNPWPLTVELIGPAGERIRLKGKSSKDLDEYYDRYADRGYIQRMNESTENRIDPITPDAPTIVSDSRAQINNSAIVSTQRRNNIHRTTPIKNPPSNNQSVVAIEKEQQDVQKPNIPKTLQRTNSNQPIEILPTSRGLRRRVVEPPVVKPHNIANLTASRTRGPKKLVGKAISGDALAIYKNNVKKAPYRISNGIAVGVMSYNRGKSLLRFVESFRRTVDLNRVVLFISDDGSTDSYTQSVLTNIAEDPRIVVIRNTDNLGISSNSNRLLRCMSRFDHFFICNDDVEFLKSGWIEFYVRAALQSGFHHFCYRQPNVYSAKIGEQRAFSGVKMYQVEDKPHGAMLYMSGECLRKIGYFDAEYKIYGMEHVDWSMRPAEMNLQPVGFFDVVGSTDYIRIHAEASSIENKTEYYINNKARFNKRTPGVYVPPDHESIVPKISYVIPCRDIDRSDSIKSVVMGVVGQSFPEIEIWLVEQDCEIRVNYKQYRSINYLFVDGGDNQLFNKSMAFNKAVDRCTSDSVILHDADMLSRVDYTQRTYALLRNYDAIHICGRVVYLNAETTNRVNNIGYIPEDSQFERIVGYFEGGSLACKISAYWQMGGFNEDFWGYGCEDCDFYARISCLESWLNNDEFDLIHLWHGRADGWNDHHQQNKKIEAELNALSIPQRIRIQQQQMKALGYSRHYL